MTKNQVSNEQKTIIFGILLKFQIILCLSFQIPGTWLFERTQPGWHHPFSLFLLPNKYLFGNCDFQVKFWCFLMQKNISRRRNFDQIEHIPETKCALVWGFHCFQQSWLFNSVGNQQNLTIRIQQNLEQCFKFDQTFNLVGIEREGGSSETGLSICL